MHRLWTICSVFFSVVFVTLSIWLVVQYDMANAKMIRPEEKEINIKTDGVTVREIPVLQQFLPVGYAGRPGITREIKWVVIHETANHSLGSNSDAHYAYLLNVAKEKNLSWHYTVDDHQIIHMLPDYEVGWHAGDGTAPDGGNMCGIGIELAVNDDGDFEKTIENGAGLAAYLLKEYGLGIESLKMHGDFSGKNCPMTLRNSGRWSSFVEKVSEYYSKI